MVNNCFFVPRIFEFSILSESLSFGSSSNFGSSSFENSWWIWNRSCNSTIANATCTSYVVISWEAERFVNEIHDHKEELRSSNELLTELQGSVKSEPCEERKGSSHNKGTCVNSFSNPPQRASVRTKNYSYKREEKGGHSCSFTRRVLFSNCCIEDSSTMLRHCDQEERQTDGSRHWDTIRPTLVRAFAQEGARDFAEGFWLTLIHEGSNKLRIEYCEDQNGSLCYLGAIRGHSGGIPIRTKLMNYTLIPYNWKERTSTTG